MITNADIEKLKEVFPTKEDLERFATKEDLKNHPTHDWMQNIIDQLIKTMGEMFETQNQRLDKRFDEIHNDITAHQRQLDNHETRILKIEKNRSN